MKTDTLENTSNGHPHTEQYSGDFSDLASTNNPFDISKLDTDGYSGDFSLISPTEPVSLDLSETVSAGSYGSYTPKKKSQYDFKSLPKTSSFERLIMAIDTEYVASGDGKRNIILSYQSTLITPGGKEYSQIFYPQSREKHDRFSWPEFVLKTLDGAIDAEIINGYPTDINVVAHFARADIFNFKEVFLDLKTVVKGVQRSVVSLGDAYGIDLGALNARKLDKNTNIAGDEGFIPARLYFYDTMPLAPGKKSLSALGELVGVGKVELPAGYRIEAMDKLLEDDQDSFEEYALTDTIITARYFAKVRDFCQEQGLGGIPYTLGGLSVSKFKHSLNLDEDVFKSLFGYTEKSYEYWPKAKETSTSIRPITKIQRVLRPGLAAVEPLATECYHGGRSESFLAGLTEKDSWYDFDIASCYTVFLSALRPLDYDNFFLSRNIEDYSADKCCFAYVKFEFSDSCRFPCLPVRTDKYGLVFPLQGYSYCTGAEIATAVRMGAKLEIQFGFIVPWKPDSSPIFENYMKTVREMRNHHDKGSFMELLWKELGNSLYGKTAQGLRGKNGFNAEDGLSTPLPPSPVTNAPFAAFITGGSRALLGELLHSIPEDKTVVSVTTDGFLTNATLDEIDLQGPMASYFRKLFHNIDPDGGEILKLKHGAHQLVAMKTRGQLTLEPIEGLSPVTAKAGVKPPKTISDHNAYMVDLYLKRKPGDLTDASHLISTRDQFLGQRDLISISKEQRLSLEPDMKRQFVNPRMISAGEYSHLACDSVPHRTVEDMEFIRVRFDNWRVNHCLKTLDDYADWQEYISMSSTVPKGVRLQKGETSDHFLARMFVRGYTQGQWGFSDNWRERSMNGRELSEWFESQGVVISQDSIRSAKRAEMVNQAVPVTLKNAGLIKALVQQFPEFEPHHLFPESEHEALEGVLSSE